MNNKISVIIPVYNVERYLERCLDSLVNQIHKNIEIILINDGSTDSSKSICEKYVQNDDRIRLINQKNGGSSIARNSGLDAATGDIIAFIDSDDYIEDTMFSSMFECMQTHNLDVVEIAPIGTDNNKEFSNKLVIEDSVTSSVRVIKNTAFSVWRRIYKKALVNEMRFIPGIIHQDVFYTIDVLNKAKKIGYLDKPLYVYNTENISIIRSKYSIEKINTGIRATEYIINKSIDHPKVKSAINNYVVFYYTDHYFLLSRNKSIDPEKKFRNKLRKEIYRRINSKNVGLRSLLVLLAPKWFMEFTLPIIQKIK
jgi:glycosyltransferase involved in cell wall biosynthesis